MKSTRIVFAEPKKKNILPLYTIGIVSELVGTTNQTLRIYEKHGLINPSRKNKNRFYSENDIRWLMCLRELIHVKKISIEGIKKLLEYAPCWEITKCSEKERNGCVAFINRTKPCWEINKMICTHNGQSSCSTCFVYQSRAKKTKGNGNGGKTE